MSKLRQKPHKNKVFFKKYLKNLYKNKLKTSLFYILFEADQRVHLNNFSPVKLYKY